MRRLLALLFLLPLARPGFAAKPYDAELDRLTARLASPDEKTRVEAMDGLRDLLWKPGADEALAARLLEISRERSRVEASVQPRAAADLIRIEVERWSSYAGPPARERERVRQETLRRNVVFRMSVVLALIFGGGLLLVAVKVVGAFLAIHGDDLLEGGARGSALLFLRHPALLIVPTVNAALFAALAGLALWHVGSDPALTTPGGGDEIYRRAVSIAYRPESLAAVAFAFCAAMLSNTVFLAARVRGARGQNAGLLWGALDMLRVCVPVAILSAVVCAALVGLDWASRRLGRLLSASERIAASFGKTAVESATMLVLNTAVCAMLFEDAGPARAMERAVEMIKPDWWSALRAVTATSILRSTDVLTIPLLCGQIALIPGMVLFLFRFEPSDAWLLNGGLALVFAGILAAGGVMASFVLALAWMLDAAFAAAFYLHATGERPSPSAPLRALEPAAGK